MGSVRAPSPSSMRGMILDVLKRAGEKGLSCDNIMHAADVPKEIRVQAAVHDLRKSGYRIDFHDGRYHFLGRGVSFTTRREGQQPQPMGGIKFRAKVRAAIQKRQGSTQVGAPVRYSPTPKIPMSTAPTLPYQGEKKSDVFHIDKEGLARAMRVMPEAQRQELARVAQRAEQYNAAIELFHKAEDSLRKILGEV